MTTNCGYSLIENGKRENMTLSLSHVNCMRENSLSFSFSLLIDSSEHQHKIHLNGARSANYHSIEWTQPRIDQLYTMYIQEPLSMQCNRSDGQRYDGRNWEGVPTTPVQIKIPIHRKLCPNYNPLWLKPLEKGECDLLGECIY